MPDDRRAARPPSPITGAVLVITLCSVGCLSIGATTTVSADRDEGVGVTIDGYLVWGFTPECPLYGEEDVGGKNIHSVGFKGGASTPSRAGLVYRFVRSGKTLPSRTHLKGLALTAEAFAGSAWLDDKDPSHHWHLGAGGGVRMPLSDGHGVILELRGDYYRNSESGNLLRPGLAVGYDFTTRNCMEGLGWN